MIILVLVVVLFAAVIVALFLIGYRLHTEHSAALPEDSRPPLTSVKALGVQVEAATLGGLMIGGATILTIVVLALGVLTIARGSFDNALVGLGIRDSRSSNMNGVTVEHITESVTERVTETVTENTLPPVPEDISIVQPRPGDTVQACVSVQGTGSPPEGTVLAVAAQLEGELQKFFETEVQLDTPTDGQWSARIALYKGEEIARRSERVFSIRPVLLESHWGNYLATTHEYEGDDNTWWASPEWPPVSHRLDVVRVVRKRSGEC